MVVCGSNVRVCLLGSNNAVFTLMVMDVAMKPGREAFVEFLVNCTFCDTNNLYCGLPITTTTGNDGGSGRPAPIWPSCKHRRIVMEPVGRPLRFAKSIPELIVILHDIMECHSTIIEECQILRHDISTNNILIIQPKSGCIAHNLEDSPVEQIALDDQELLLYMVY
ncbi:hypothetical protein EV182_000901 [Spiromyces aspiralis]|uniref:Uncharacterized protein n=1 Tax=Spiromyces aspiralis TaxID=68401 RepID=A0ACC1HJR9_9FUNG|nr:hypothetical protein EV182_000901 [Spiromyces aspiralis]